MIFIDVLSCLLFFGFVGACIWRLSIDGPWSTKQKVAFAIGFFFWFVTIIARAHYASTH